MNVFKPTLWKSCFCRFWLSSLHRYSTLKVTAHKVTALKSLLTASHIRLGSRLPANVGLHQMLALLSRTKAAPAKFKPSRFALKCERVQTFSLCLRLWFALPPDVKFELAKLCLQCLSFELAELCFECLSFVQSTAWSQRQHAKSS